MGNIHRFRPRKPANEYQRRKALRHRPKESRREMIVGAAVVMVIAGSAIGLEVAPPLIGCSVKGNISPNTGERIYHVPGQEHYWETRISWFKGERWFCSEEAARAAGWRKAFR